jgi:hypothetical protein
VIHLPAFQANAQLPAIEQKFRKGMNLAFSDGARNDSIGLSKHPYSIIKHNGIHNPKNCFLLCSTVSS